MGKQHSSQIDLLGQIFSLKVIIAGVLISCLLSTATISFLLATRKKTPAQTRATITLIVYPAHTPSPSSIPVIAEETTQSTPSAQISKGGKVRITGTGGDGLRLRDNPGLSGKVLILGKENEIFQVLDGPADADGYIWWLLVNFEDNTQKGWGVSDFLQVVDGS